MPDRMPQTHYGVATEGKRHILFARGELGPYCSPCTDVVYVYDTKEQARNSLLALTKKRHLGLAQLWHDRLHIIAGSKEDRNTPSSDHWRIGVGHGIFVVEAWREERSIPRGGIHRGSAILNDSLYIIGGVEGDIKPIEGDPQIRCNWRTPTEAFHGELYRLRHGVRDWERL